MGVLPKISQESMKDLGVRVVRGIADIGDLIYCEFCRCFGKARKALGTAQAEDECDEHCDLSCQDDDDNLDSKDSILVSEKENFDVKKRAMPSSSSSVADSKRGKSGQRMWSKNSDFKIFHPGNIRRHHERFHADKWKEYNLLKEKAAKEASEEFEKGNASTSARKAIETFFDSQTRITDSFPIASSVDNHIVVKNTAIVNLIKQFFIDDESQSSNPEKIASAERTFNEFCVPVFSDEVSSDGTRGHKKLSAYKLIVKNLDAYEVTVKLLPLGLSNNQIVQVVKVFRESYSLGAQLPSVSSAEISIYSRISAIIGLCKLSDIAQSAWTYSLGFDMSKDRFQNDNLDIRLRAPATDGSDTFDFHSVLIPMSESHTGENIANRIAAFQDAIDPNWKVKIMGISSDGAASNTGHKSGAITLLEEKVATPLMRVWCAPHQLDLAVSNTIKDLGGMPDVIGKAKTLSGYLRKQTVLIRKGLICPSYTEVRWSSLTKLLQWISDNRKDINDHISAHKDGPEGINDYFWLMIDSLTPVFVDVSNTMTSIQGTWHVVETVERELKALYSKIGLRVNAYTTTEIVEKAVYKKREDGMIELKFGRHVIPCNEIINYVHTSGLQNSIIFRGLRNESGTNFLKTLGSFLIVLLDKLSFIGIKRDSGNNPDRTESPPVFPNDFADLSTIELSDIMIKFQKRFDLVGINSEEMYKGVMRDHLRLRTLRRELCPTQFVEAQREYEKKGFKSAWDSLPNNYFFIRILASGFATVMPSTARVESDFSIVNFLRGERKFHLTGFALEGILQTQQFDIMDEFLNILKVEKSR